MTLNQRVPGSSPGAQPATDSSLAEKPLLRPFLARGGLRFPVSAQRYRLQVPFSASVSGGRNPVPDSRLTTTATRLTEMPRQRWQVMATYLSQPLRRQLAFGTDPMISSGSILR